MMTIFFLLVLLMATSFHCVAVESGKVEEPAVVFFQALLSQNVYISSSQTVIFDAIVTNFGNAYNPNTGEFTAPYGGVYYFTSSFLKALGSPNLGLVLVSRRNTLAQGYAASGGDHSPGSMSAVVYLKKGDTVKVIHHSGFGAQTIRGDSWSAFTGYLITKTE